MIQISDKTKCCGCTACASVCPKNCISMQCDGEGFLYPIVDADSCVNCGLCERVCSQLSEHEEERTDCVKYIACQNTNENVRKVSTSGGMFGLLAEQVIASGGTIWAAGFDDSAIVVHKEAREFDELNDLYGSKYVQSDLKDTFKKIRQELITSDKTVLFVGTPCQVEGLLYYLGKKEKELLLTVDLVCYGVPSPGLYKEWIQDIAQKHGSKVSRVYFRDKKYGYAGVNVKVMLQNGQVLEDIVDVKTYTKTMFSKIGLRPSCYKCVYRGRNKMSDFTIGDFWQIGDYSKQMDDDRGTSIVQINTRKGEDFLNDISSEKIKKIHVETLENDDLKSKIHKEDYTFEIPKNRLQFFEDSGRMSYDDLIQKYFLVGSDQLWLPSGLASGFYNLQFVPDEKLKIAYATSFGVSKIPMHQKNKTAKYLDRFHYLSSREKSGTNIIKQLTGRDVPVVVDPTLLLTPEDWKEIIPFHRVVEEKYIFCYFLGDNSEHRKAAKELQRATNLKIVTLPLLDNFVLDDLEFADICLFDAASDDFVNLIRGAEYVLTDSFHGSVFSILNEKLFCTFNRFNNGTGSRNSRIDSLCQQLNLESRRYDGDIFKVQTRIDYNKVNLLREERRKESLQYLTTALKGEITIG